MFLSCFKTEESRVTVVAKLPTAVRVSVHLLSGRAPEVKIQDNRVVEKQPSCRFNKRLS